MNVNCNVLDTRHWCFLTSAVRAPATMKMPLKSNVGPYLKILEGGDKSFQSHIQLDHSVYWQNSCWVLNDQHTSLNRCIVSSTYLRKARHTPFQTKDYPSGKSLLFMKPCCDNKERRKETSKPGLSSSMPKNETSPRLTVTLDPLLEQRQFSEVFRCLCQHWLFSSLNAGSS